MGLKFDRHIHLTTKISGKRYRIGRAIARTEVPFDNNHTVKYFKRVDKDWVKCSKIEYERVISDENIDKELNVLVEKFIEKLKKKGLYSRCFNCGNYEKFGNEHCSKCGTKLVPRMLFTKKVK